ncbi:MAG: NAD(P)-dependent oxidoreductase [Burkholderiaceae bacterium]|jgi:2-hydroxy-3-oxopropionate reductase|nr:NAD(P)-dependent oxidoreductase [Burkholderiaceae bacterium]
MPRVAFCGIGLMGLPMATRLCEAGYPLTAWNRTLSRAEPLRAFGAQVADLPSVAVTADILITMLADGAAVLQVLSDVLPVLRPGTLVIDMSSTRQSEARQIHQLLASRQVAFLDAPVSGGVLGAKDGTLAIMVGGAPEDFARAVPVFNVMGRPTRVGDTGCGQLAKLCNQLIVGGTISIVAEALLLAEAGGADPAAVRAAIRGGFAESRVLEVHGQRMLERDFVPGGQVKSQAKDLDNVMIAAAEADDLQLPVTERVTELYHSIQDAYDEADQSAVLLALEQRNPGKRVGTAPTDRFQVPGSS